MEPGTVISPGQKPDEAPKATETTKESEATSKQPKQPMQTSEELSADKPEVPATAKPQEDAPKPSDENIEPQKPTKAFTASGFEDSATGVPENEPPANVNPQASIEWSASEYIAHQKSIVWYLGLAGAGLIVTALVYLVTRDKITAGVFPIVTILFGVFAARQPEVLQYGISPSGIAIGKRHYSFDDFKSFSVHEDGPLPSAFFWPTKRFMPGLTIYFPPEQAHEILDTLSLYLPHEDHEPDAVDRLMRRVRF